MNENLKQDGLLTTRKKYTPALKTESVRQVAVGAHHSRRPRQSVYLSGLSCRAHMAAGGLLSFSRQGNPMVMPRPKPAEAPSKPNYCPAAAPLPRWKMSAWKWATTSTPTSTSTAATPPSATARPTKLNTN
nr:hypothetical protein [Hymenobacter roseosalivarius]